MRDTAVFFKALSDEARLRILALLFQQPELCVCDIMEVLDFTQSKASRHLRTLENAGIVTGRREGLWVHYALVRPADQLAAEHLKMLRKTLADREEAEELRKRLAARMKRKGCCR